MERLGAVVSGADADAFRREDLCDIMRMDAFDFESDEAFFFFRICRSDDVDEGELLHAFQATGDEAFFLCADLVKSDGLYITDRCDEADSAFDILGAGFEFGRELGVGGLL